MALAFPLLLYLFTCQRAHSWDFDFSPYSRILEPYLQKRKKIPIPTIPCS